MSWRQRMVVILLKPAKIYIQGKTQKLKPSKKRQKVKHELTRKLE